MNFFDEIYLSNYIKYHVPENFRGLRPERHFQSCFRIVQGILTIFRQEFSKKSLNVTNSEKTRESLFTFLLSSADLTSI